SLLFFSFSLFFFVVSLSFFFSCSLSLRSLLSFPTRRSSDLDRRQRRGGGSRVHRRARDQAGGRLHRRRLGPRGQAHGPCRRDRLDRKSTRLNSSHVKISYAVFCLKKKKNRGSDSTKWA